MTEPSLQDLEEMEKFVQHRLTLLNQADQLLQQEKAAFESFKAKHPDRNYTGHDIADAIQHIETVLNSLVDQHNTLVGMIQEAKESVKQYEPESI